MAVVLILVQLVWWDIFHTVNEKDIGLLYVLQRISNNQLFRYMWAIIIFLELVFMNSQMILNVQQWPALKYTF